jgi:hypothetical protein
MVGLPFFSGWLTNRVTLTTEVTGAAGVDGFVGDRGYGDKNYHIGTDG